MISKNIVLSLCCVAALAMSGCSRQQSDWQKTRETNTVDAYEQFLKKYPSGEFTAQAGARVKEMYEERDWQKARDADTPEAYQAFLKQYPEGKWTEEARIRVENFTLAQAPSGSTTSPPGGAEPGGANPGIGNSDSGATAATIAAGAATAAGAAAVATTPPPKAMAQTPVEAAPAAPGHPRVAATLHPHAAGSTGKAGTYGVQLGAFKSGAQAAHERWAHLQKEYPSLLGGLSSKVSKANAGSLHRLRVAGLTEKRAREICSTLKAKSEACVVVPPGQG